LAKKGSRYTEGVTNTVPTLENFPFCPADAAIVANIPLADIGMIY
jgi:hypothetical protein